jgi:hypothetical protein
MSKPRSVRSTWPKYYLHQEKRAKLQLERIEAWLKEHQEPHELRIRELLTRQVECWR